MTLTTDRPQRREQVRREPVPAAPASPAPPVPVARLVLPDVYRVSVDAVTVGYVQVAGPVYVGLSGAVYNTSVEVGQHLDLEVAVQHLVAVCGDAG